MTVRDDRAPTAVLDVAAEAALGQDIVLEGRRSFDAAGRMVRWEWTHVSGPGGLPLGTAFVTSATSFTVPSAPADPCNPACTPSSS